ncbi:MAG: hypothetical protein LAP61_07310 [Acidobacteriia bacterium]|nr:hypothetical protein [Terriglobia bacterium]
MKARFLALIVLSVTGYFTRPLFESFILSVATSKAPACLDMLGNTTTEDNGGTYIIGSIRNSCDRKFGRVTVSFKIDHQRVATGELPEATVSAYTRDLEPGQTKEFRTSTSVSKDTSYRFDAISAY